jgi:hypothetical protein
VATADALAKLNETQRAQERFVVLVLYWDDVERLISRSQAMQSLLNVAPVKLTTDLVVSSAEQILETARATGSDDPQAARARLALFRNEVQRVRDEAYRVNCFIWHPAPPSRYANLARSGWRETELERLLPRVFHLLDGDQNLVEGINSVRERLSSVREASERVRLGIEALADYASTLREEVPQLVMSADRVLQSIDSRR